MFWLREGCVLVSGRRTSEDPMKKGRAAKQCKMRMAQGCSVATLLNCADNSGAKTLTDKGGGSVAVHVFVLFFPHHVLHQAFGDECSSLALVFWTRLEVFPGFL